VFIAKPEKALLDYIYLNMGNLKENTLIDSLRLQNTKQLKKRKIIFFAKQFNSKKLLRITKYILKRLYRYD